ncbi:MAG TPA: serine/threonine-protein kinase, partial [Myxococcales bacterium]|nr:serine/threonine-protein kinase [Myxococcales bacterium]
MSATCDGVQLALVEGRRDARVEAHLRECAECRRQDLGGVLREAAEAPHVQPEGPLGRELESFLAKKLDLGELVYGRYRLLRLLGRGGQGVVYLAEDHEYRERPRQVALKFVRTDAREAAFALEIQHPNVCRIFHTELKDGGVRLILMEHVEGGTLRERAGTLTRAQALRCFVKICQGVEAAHQRDILHLDLKPQNVLLRADGEPAVTDFGLAGALDERGEGDSRGGTRHYMAPEQKRREKVDRRADVYALGRILDELLGDRPSPYRWISRRATRARPEERFQSVASLRRAASAVRLAGRAAVGLAVLAVLARPAALAYEQARGCPGFDAGRISSSSY